MILARACGSPAHLARRWSLSLRRLVGAAPILAILLFPLAARAQPKERDPVAAEALFRVARQLVEAGDYASGCPKFEASLALYPSASTMLNIADCHEHEGKIATALEDYRQAVVLNRETIGEERKKKVAKIAQQGIGTLEPRVPKLRILIDGAPSGLKIVRDGKLLPAASLGEALPADPGRHEISVSAPGYRSETRSVILEEGKTATVAIPLVAEPTGAASAKAGVGSWVWVVTGGAGLALTGAGIYFLVDDLAAIDELRARCHTNEAGTFCEPKYDYAHDNARKDRGFGLFLGLGGAGVIATGFAVVGLAQALSAKAPASPAHAVAFIPWVAPGSAGAMISGAF